jgi:hypothetical protein
VRGYVQKCVDKGKEVNLTSAINKDTITRGLRWVLKKGCGWLAGWVGRWVVCWALLGGEALRAGACITCLLPQLLVLCLTTVRTAWYCPLPGTARRYSLATGNWGVVGGPGEVRPGVSQVLNRLTYASTLSHLRRINSPIGREGKIAKPRQLHNSQWGMICPAGGCGCGCGCVVAELRALSLRGGYSPCNLPLSLLLPAKLAALNLTRPPPGPASSTRCRLPCPFSSPLPCYVLQRRLRGRRAGW